MCINEFSDLGNNIYFVFPEPNQNGIPYQKGDFSWDATAEVAETAITRTDTAVVRVRFVPMAKTKNTSKQKWAREK